jgi:hypothetical protein
VETAEWFHPAKDRIQVGRHANMAVNFQFHILRVFLLVNMGSVVQHENERGGMQNGKKKTSANGIIYRTDVSRCDFLYYTV